MIEVEHLTRVADGRRILDGVSFRAAAGEVLGFLGPNGAGKTTTLRILAGALPPTAGRTSVAGAGSALESRAARASLGWLPERVPVYGDPRAGEYVEFFARARGLRGGEARRAAAAALGDVDLAPLAGRRVGRLSKGERQRVGLAAALVGDPPVLLLDEPTSGLDPGQLRRVRGLVASLRGRRTVLLSTHLLPEVEGTCDRVVVLHEGRVRAAGPPDALDGEVAGARIVLRARGGGADLAEVARAVPGVESAAARAEVDGACVLEVTPAPGADPRAGLAAAIVGAGELLELRVSRPSLEDVFVRLVAGGGGTA